MDIIKAIYTLELANLQNKIKPEVLESTYIRNIIDLYKSWSSDLQEQFPNGGWRTINGAKVFINGGKVIAGLDGFNREIDEFFSKKDKQSKETKEEIPVSKDGLYQIYTVNVKQKDGSVEKMYGVPSSVNRGKRGFGDHLVNTLDQAIRMAEYERYNEGVIDKRREERRLEKQKQEEEDQAKKERNKGKTGLEIMNEAKDAKILDVKMNYNGVIQTRREHTASIINNGGYTKTEEVNKVKDVSNTVYNRMNGRQQEELERKIKEGGKKTEYQLYTKDGSYYTITRAEYEYARQLENKEVSKETKESKEIPKKENSVKESDLTDSDKEYFQANKKDIMSVIENDPLYSIKDAIKDHKEKKEKPINQERELTDKEKGMLENYKEDKKAFINGQFYKFEEDSSLKTKKQNIASLIKDAPNEEYRNMLKEVEKAIDERIAEPEKVKNEHEKAAQEVSQFVDDDDKFSFEKLKEGDFLENIKKIDAYNKKAKKAGKSPEYAMPYGIYEGQTVEITKKEPRKVRETSHEDALKGIVSNDPIRPVFQSIYYDPEGYKVATDSNKLIWVKTDVGEKSGKLINPKTGENVEGSYPNYKSVIPNYKDSKPVKLSELHSLTKQATEISKKTTPISLMNFENILPDHHFSPELMNDAIESLRKLGVEKAEIKYGGIDRMVVFSGKTSKGEEVNALVMPMNKESNTWHGTEPMVIKAK